MHELNARAPIKPPAPTAANKISALAINQHWLKTDKQIDGEVLSGLINIAGRQRMLSQRIILHVALAAQGNPEALEISHQALKLFTESHEKLVTGNENFPGLFSEKLMNVYRGDKGYNSVIWDFIQKVDVTLDSISRNGANTRQELIDDLTQQATPILAALNEATLVFEQESREYSDNVKNTLTSNQENLETVLNRVLGIVREAHIISSNARIISARSGQAGREFDVVATELQRLTMEINKLAQSALSNMKKPEGY